MARSGSIRSMRSRSISGLAGSALFAASAVAVLGTLLAAPPAHGEDGWEQISDEDGIVVWQRPVPGTSLVEFRGKAEVKAGMKTILAVLNDQKHKTEWMENCVQNDLVRYHAPGRVVVYHRIGSAFPLVDDRDVVAASKLAVFPEERRVRIDVASVEDPKAPVVDGVVRMPKLKLVWELVAVSAERTRVMYQAQADPGGSLPAWLVNTVSKKLPHNTLSRLRTQVGKDYSESLAQVDAAYDWSTVAVADEKPAKNVATP